MSVDLDAIAQRGRCEVSSLRLALPLLEQGYTPPFLARYRRDELGDVDESSLWALSSALQSQRHVAERRDELHQAWERTSLRDPAIGHAINKSNSLRMLARLGRRLKSETSDSVSDATRLAVRIANPQKGDGSDFAAIAAKVEGITDPDAAVSGLDDALAKRLAGDPRMIAAAVRWLVKHARIHIVSISDPHISSGDDRAENEQSTKASEPPAKAATDATTTAETAASSESTADPKSLAGAEKVAGDQDANANAATDTKEAAAEATETSALVTAAQTDNDADTKDASPPDATASTPPPSDTTAAAAPAAADVTATSEVATSEVATSDVAASDVAASDVAASDKPTGDKPTGDKPTGDKPTGDEAGGDEAGGDEATSDGAGEANASTPQAPKKTTPVGDSGKPAKAAKPASKGAKKQKKISPRQRRRRWLVGVLKPLAGKRFNSDKLSSFQIVMLGRALRSQVAQCSFEYDASKLVAELQRAAGNMNRQVDQKLREIVLQNEAAIREAAESAWWDDLQERASARLVSITADHLRRHVNRGGVEAKVVMSIDAIGPRTAATSIVAADGRLLHCEDLPCQLSSALRAQAVMKMGELIHTYHVDLIVISNGPARRASMIALGDLVSQSPEKSVRWTLADRSGADAYASSGIADHEMRSTPRRFRAAAWLAFSILQPAQALAKVDPLKLRLSSFQRELSDDALSRTLEDVMVSGASRGGVDINSAPTSWLSRLPGMNPQVAEAIDAVRHESLFDSRESVLALEQWESTTQSRQAVPFLRVFRSQEVLDGTLVHPEDYVLARKLARSLEIELPPDAPPGYVPPDYKASEPVSEPDQLSEATPQPETKIEVEDFSAAGQDAREFAVDPVSGSEAEAETTDQQPPTEAEQTTDTAEPESAAGAEPVPAADEPETGDTPEHPSATEDPIEPKHAVAAVGDGESSPESSPEEPEEVAAAGETSQSDQSEAPPADQTPAGQAAADQAAADQAAADQTAADQTAADQAPASTPVSVADLPEPIKRPLPDKAKIEKCIKEWQIGARRAHQLVHWLCDPFGDSDATGNPPAVLSSMPSSKGLKPGDKVIGVVVGVMPFGVFLELAPDCSGLIHVSRISDSYVEDLHEAIQVGDVVTAWVTGIDEKRKRVALSAVSPQREAEIEAAKSARHDRPRARASRGGPPRGGPPRGRSDGPQSQGAARGGGSRSAKPAGKGAGRGKDQGRGGRQRDGGGRSRDTRGRGRERKPESYRVVSKQEAKPISDAMQKGEEPLRSFGDLMQFLGSAEKSGKPEPEKPPSPAPDSASSSSDDTTAATEHPASSSDNTVPAADAGSQDAPQVNPPAAPQVNPDAGQQTTDETKAKKDQLDTDPPTESSSPADASTS